MTDFYLSTNFHDYYDHAFASRYNTEAKEFRRFSNEGMPKREQLFWLESHGWMLPAHGTVAELNYPYFFMGPMVVYTDEMKHQGEGKIVLPSNIAELYYPDHFATVYVGGYSAMGPAISYRYLFIGARCWKLKYTGYNSWQSNYADSVDIELLVEVPTRGAPYDFPLWAVDVVPYCEMEFAIDLNIAPEIKGTGIEDFVTPKECYELIKGAMNT